MASEVKDGPLIALVLALSTEQINMLQAAHDQFREEGDKEAAQQASIRLERLCMLQSLVEMQAGRAVEKANEPTPVEAITAYLQAHDPDTFPISLTPYAGGKTLLLETAIGINGDTEQWLDMHYSGTVVLSKAPRSSPTEQAFMDAVIGTENKKTADVQFPATRNPGFVPERLPTPPRPDNAPIPHNPVINAGMPIDGEVQGMPGGRLGDKA